MTVTDGGVPDRARWRIDGAWVAIPLIAVGLWLLWSTERFWRLCWGGWSSACQDVVMYGDLSWMYAFVWGAHVLCLAGAAVTRPWRWMLGAVPALAVANVVDVFTHWSADVTEWYGVVTGSAVVLVGVFLLVQPHLPARRGRPQAATAHA